MTIIEIEESTFGWNRELQTQGAERAMV